MRLHSLLLSITCLILSACATSPNPIEDSSELRSASPTYDAELAEALGADDYGMRSYILAILKTGPNDATITDEVKRKELFAGHFSNMGRMAEAGQLLLAGPLDGKMARRGIYVFNVKTIDEGQKLIQTDPSIAAGIFEVELHQYYGSAALMRVNDIHKRVQKTLIE